MKKVICFMGSPRKEGTSATVAEHIMKGARDNGAETKNFYLNTMKIKGCQGCYGCVKLDAQCVQKDDMAPIYDEIKNADAIIIASPIYMGQMTAQTKLFTDRLMPFLNVMDFSHKLGNGKKTVLVYSHGQPDPNTFKSSMEMNKGAYQLLGLNIQETIVAAGTMNPTYTPDEALLKQAYDAGKKIVE